MPIYEYRCSSCGTEHEALQKISEPPLSTCPSCRKDTLTKLVSAAGFQLKGSGWYATDFKNSNKPAAKANGKAEGKDSGKGGDASTPASDGKSSEGSSSESKSASASGGCGSNCGCH